MGWFARWKAYPLSVLGHIAQGAVAGIAAAAGLTPMWVVMLVGYLAYQFGSGARKAVNTHATDTIGLDAFDFAVGFVPAYILTLLVITLFAGV